MLIYRKFFAAILLLSGAFLHASAQDEPLRNLSIDVGGGGAFIYGDIQSDFTFNGQLGAKYNLSKIFGLKANMTTGVLKGNQDIVSFKNNFFQYSLRGVFNVSQLANFNRQFPRINLHSYAGVGRLSNNAEFKNANNPDQNQNFNESLTSIPLGINLEYFLSNRIDLFADFNYNFTNNDFVDGYSPALNANKSNDGYSTLTIGLSYKLGPKNREHADWSQSDNMNRRLTKVEEKQEEAINAVEKKIDVLQTRIANYEKNNINEVELREYEQQINQNLEALRSDIQTPLSHQDNSKIREPGNRDINIHDLSNKRFVNVIGSFKSIKRAKTFTNNLDQEGYKAGILYDYPNNYYYVHVTQNYTLKEAQQAIQKTRKDFGIEGSWIYFRSADDLEKL